MAKKIRIDELLVARGLCPSLTPARAAIMAGEVFIGGARVDKASVTVPVDIPIDLRGKEHPFVSRGGLKLAGALDSFGIAINGINALDIGASTGGFTDCLLQRGAKMVYALDVGKGLLAWRLRSDQRVVVIEGCNIRYFDKSVLTAPIDLITIDVSFISLLLVIPIAVRILRANGELLALIKPQFEARREQVTAGGVISDEAIHKEVVEKITSFCKAQEALAVHGVCEAKPAGRDGNKEFFIRVVKEGQC